MIPEQPPALERALKLALLTHLEDLGHVVNGDYITIGQYVMSLEYYDTIYIVSIHHSPISDVTDYAWTANPTTRTDEGCIFSFSIYGTGVDDLLNFLDFAHSNINIPLYMLNEHGQLDQKVQILYGIESYTPSAAWRALKRALSKHTHWFHLGTKL